MDKKRKIAVVLSTGNIENDDRIRKEIISIQKMDNFQVKIFAKVNKNIKKDGITTYGTPYRQLYLKSRDIFPSAKFLTFKIMEMYFRLRKELKQYDILWCADEAMFIFPLFIKNKPIIWDLHEIPQLFLKNNFTKKLFHFLERKCNFIIHANQYRLNYLIEQKVVLLPDKHFIIRNYPDQEFIKSTLLPPSYQEIKQWLNHSKYVYLQGISDSSRYPYHSIVSILQSTDLKILITGNPIDNNLREQLIAEFGNLFNERVYFTGMLDQLYTPAIIKDAVFSMVYYHIVTPNERLCEANRFYQSLVFGVPIICGCNEPMKEIIDQYHCGIALKSDGSDLGEIKTAIKKMLANYEYYSANTMAVKDLFVWNDKGIYNLLDKFSEKLK